MPSSNSSRTDIIPPYELQDMKKNEQPAISNQELENEVEYFNGESKGSKGESSGHNSGRNDGSANGGFFKSFVDGFRRQTHHSQEDDLENDLTSCISPGTLNQYKKSSENSSQLETKKEEDQLKKSIKPRHVVMISLGTGIGTGLLVGNSKALYQAGPAGLVLGFAIMGSCIYCIVQAAGEMAVVYSNLVGGFNAYPSMLVSPTLGFAVAWVYWLQWACVCPLELVTASMTIKYWTTKVNPDIFVVIFYVLIVVINIFGARGYAEAEFFFNCCKVLMITGFFILGIIINCGGAGDDGYIGGKYWHDPGAFRGDHAIDRFKGVVSTLVNAAFAFGGTEFIALTAGEQSNPRKSIPSAAKKVLYRIVVIFVGSIIMVGFLVPFNSDQLMGSASSKTKASPYVIAISSHGVRVVPHFINAVILLSVLSVGNSAFYSSSRILLSLSQQGYAPKFFNYIDREGRPARGMAVAALFAVIAFCAASPKEDQVFTWLLAISGLSQLFTWTMICVAHIRFRRAMTVQGRSLGEIGFRSQLGVWGSYYASVMMVLTLIAQFWVALAPIGEGKLDAQNFFENYLAMIILIVFYIGAAIWRKDWRLLISAKEIDLDSHRQIFDEDVLRQEDEETKEKLRNGPVWKRVVNFWC